MVKKVAKKTAAKKAAPKKTAKKSVAAKTVKYIYSFVHSLTSEISIFDKINTNQF